MRNYRNITPQLESLIANDQVKSAIESSGGKIYFESQEGKGTSFFIELPEAEEATFLS